MAFADSPRLIPIVKLRMLKEKNLRYLALITQPESIIKLVWPIFKGADRELFIIVGLDTRRQPTVINIVSVGNVESTQAHPREVFKPLILSNSSSFICIHNHPAGTVSPSSADRDITKTLEAAGKLLQIELVDHVILTDDPDVYFSFRQNEKL
jgi:DNA repair protein RadC